MEAMSVLLSAIPIIKYPVKAVQLHVALGAEIEVRYHVPLWD